jgi:hypothetical protein
MAEETEISTPVEETVTDTSSIDEPVETTDTPSEEPETEVNTAETETEAAEAQTQGQVEQVLLAGKYKTQEELEKGYLELQKLMSKPNEYEQKYNELVKAQEEKERKYQEEQLRNANQLGYKTVEDREADEHIKATELGWYAENLHLVPDEYREGVRAKLRDYMNNPRDINALKIAESYYPLDFVKEVTTAKGVLTSQLQREITQKREYQRIQREQALADTINKDFAEFMADRETNTAKANALRAMCHAGAIQSKEDMQEFINIYNGIVDYVKASAIKEYEATKAIESQKNKAVIDTGLNAANDPENPPTYAQIQRMNQDEFNRACEKWGIDKIINAR